MPARLWRVRDRATFGRLRTTPRRARSGPVSVAFVADAGQYPPAVAFGIGKTVGPAVVRNRLRRVLRDECARAGLPTGAYLVRVDPSAAGSASDEVRAALRAALREATSGAACR